MGTTARSNIAGPDHDATRRVLVEPKYVRSTTGTTYPQITFTCPLCGWPHSCRDIGLRNSACRRGQLLLVVR